MAEMKIGSKTLSCTANGTIYAYGITDGTWQRTYTCSSSYQPVLTKNYMREFHGQVTSGDASVYFTMGQGNYTPPGPEPTECGPAWLAYQQRIEHDWEVYAHAYLNGSSYEECNPVMVASVPYEYTDGVHIAAFGAF